MDVFFNFVSTLIDKGAKTMYVAAVTTLTFIGLFKLLDWNIVVCIGLGLFAGAISWNIYDWITRMAATAAEAKDPKRIISQIFAYLSAEHIQLLKEARHDFRLSTKARNTDPYFEKFSKVCREQKEKVQDLNIDATTRDMTIRKIEGRVLDFYQELVRDCERSWMS